VSDVGGAAETACRALGNDASILGVRHGAQHGSLLKATLAGRRLGSADPGEIPTKCPHEENVPIHMDEIPQPTVGSWVG
jgi:hypothetical protein